MSENKLTTKEYWETYYKAQHTDRSHIVKVCSFYNQFWDKLVEKKNTNKSLIEIGGYPGRYLAYLASEYGVKTTCLDYNSNVSQIEDAFKTMGVEDYNIINADFTTHEPEELYDYVVSNGFIEHFENFDEILDLHCKYLKPGGKMLIMVPNKKYLRQVYGYLCDYENLKLHNLKCMKQSVFRDFANRNNLITNTLQYYGGFPFSVHQKLNLFQKIIYKGVRFIFKGGVNNYLIKHPSKYFSATLIGVFEKPKD
ncbi:SAM-dependent methyltransferase [Winogradskyella jejuensis]|uniref:Methyltransferase domain-containing protein n=1 Tax=Winogradskyella jejuensis TaxID=1089305 RepID=A0A1M5SKK1_9FLAO|nr:class I SAM-dependent methyltransferase [Winogradskyella jejuensis]SHH39011.1 Methyltransferase domain-containing protein [Winogradskyella jejuensis]